MTYRYYVVKEIQKRPDDKLARLTGLMNMTSPLSTHLTQTSKPVSLIYAGKLADRVRDYISASDTQLPQHERKKCPRASNVESFVQTETQAVQDVKTALAIDDGRAVPWHKNLDGTMFFI